MLKSTDQLDGATVMATDGEAGTVKDVYFDDERWIARYLVVKTGGWFNRRDVLVSPFAVSGADWVNGSLQLNLTQEQIRNAPDIDTDKPVSRQHEAVFADYYGYPYYWGGPMVWGYAAYPVLPAGRPAEDLPEVANQRAMREQQQGDPHLRSSNEVQGYELRATDESVGHVEDFLLDEKDWSIRLMVVDTRNWLPGKKVMISPDHIKEVSWEARRIAVDITRAQVKDSPEFDPAQLGTGIALGGLYRSGNLPTL